MFRPKTEPVLQDRFSLTVGTSDDNSEVYISSRAPKVWAVTSISREAVGIALQ